MAGIAAKSGNLQDIRKFEAVNLTNLENKETEGLYVIHWDAVYYMNNRLEISRDRA